VLAEDQGKVTKEVKVEKASTFPDGFPHADLLTKAGFELEAVRLLSDEDLTNIEGIGPKSAEAVRAALEEK
jgi:predicted flap endonuclease-1-like 5' DNA nuclease